MLEELPNVSQVPGEPRRRWFWDRDFDLVVWYDERSQFIGFQLIYDKGGRERALMWVMGRGFIHTAVMASGSGSGRPEDGLLAQNGGFDREEVLNRFREESLRLEGPVRNFVEKGLAAYPGVFSPHRVDREVVPLREWAERLSREPVRLGNRVFAPRP